MQRAAARAHVRDALRQRGVCRERAVGDRGVDHDQALRHDAAAADVDVADFAVAHHAGRQVRPLRRWLRARCADSARACAANSASSAWAIALPCGSVRMPQPSRIASTSGGRLLIALHRARVGEQAPRTNADRDSRRRRARRRCAAARRNCADVVGLHAAAVENARVVRDRRRRRESAPMTALATSGVSLCPVPIAQIGS